MTTNLSENNKRIARNTLMLYIRMLLMMAVSLYTSRVVLRVLGVDDFGIYDVVGGVVAMLSFVNGAMAAGTQRYLTFELGRGDGGRLVRVFVTSLQIHLLIAAVLVVLAETVGLWFLYYKMTIPASRVDAAFWVYQCAVFSTVVAMAGVPYNAAIIAHERMNAFALLSVLEAVLKLFAACLLLADWGVDKLVLYAVLILAVQVGIRLAYTLYSRRHFAETRLRRMWNGRLFREMCGFVGWNLWGNCAGIAFTQGVNILLNVFFGPVVNAARGIAVQVQAAILQFAQNFQMAMNPQITKSYAVQDYAYLHSLVYRSSKFTFFLLLFLSLPVFFETKTVLTLWLGTVPEYTVTFVRLMLCVTIIDAVANPLMISASATGRVKKYQSVVGGVLLMVLPLSYVALRAGGAPWSVFAVHLGVCLSAFVVRLCIVRPMIRLSLHGYLRQVIAPIMLVTVVSVVPPLLLRGWLPGGLLGACAVGAASVVAVAASSYTLGLTPSERGFVRGKLLARFVPSRHN